MCVVSIFKVVFHCEKQKNYTGGCPQSLDIWEITSLLI